MSRLARRPLWGGLSAALLLLSLGAGAASANEPLFSQEADRGDPGPAFDRLLASFAADPSDARVPLVLSRLGQLKLSVPKGNERLKEALNKALPECGWNSDDALSALSSCLIVAGERAEALKVEGARGFLRSGLACGPFGLARNASLHAVFGPEGAAAGRDLKSDASFPGWRGERRSWREVEREPGSLSLSLGRALEGQGQVSYVVTHVKWEAEATDAFLVFWGGSAKVWCNRSLAGTIDRATARLTRKLRLPLRLQTGWNRLVFKVSGGARASFAAQLVAPTGEPLVLEESLDQPVEQVLAEAQTPQVRASLAELSSEREPARRALYALALAEEGLAEESLDVLEAVAQDASAKALSEAAWFQLLRSRISSSAAHLAAPVRRQRQKDALEAALAADPASAGARRGLALIELADARTVQGVVALEAILEADPLDLATRLTLARTLSSNDWDHEALAVLDACPKAQQGLVPVLASRMGVVRGLGRRAEAKALREQILALDASQTWVLRARFNDAIKQSDRRGAEAALKVWAQAVGATSAQIAGERRRLHAALGQTHAEIKHMRTELADRPRSVARQFALASKLAELSARGRDVATGKGGDEGARVEAIQLLQKILRESPGEHRARLLLEGLTGEEDTFWKAYEPTIAQLRKGSPKREHWPRANTVLLFDQTVTKIYPDTSSVDVVHQVWRMLDEGGKEKLAEIRDVGETLAVRTIRPDGSSLEPIRTDTGVYQMPGLRPGVLVEHSFRTRQRAANFQYSNGPFYFQDPDLVEPFWISRWIVWIHEDAPVKVIERNLKGKVRHTTRRQGPWVIHVYEARNQPKLQPEPLQPDRKELLPWIQLLEPRTLDELDGLYRERALAGKAPAPSVARKAAEVVAGVSGVKERALALLNFCHEHVRAGGQGTPAQILASRRGSKTTLFLALLEAAGVPYEVVLTGQNPHSGDPTDWLNPQFGQFGAPLVRINPESKDAFYVLPAAHRFVPRDLLPTELWGAHAYMCSPRGGKLTVLPTGNLDDTARRTRLRLTLQADGGAKGELSQEVRAFGAYGAKERLASAQPYQLRGLFANQVSQLFPGATVEQHGLPGLEEAGVPLRWRARFSAPRAVRARGDGALVFRGFMNPSQLSQTLGTHRTRIFDLVLEAPAVTRDRVEIDLGPYACPTLPRSVRLSSRQFQYSLRASRPSPGKLLIEREVTLLPGRIKPSEYEAFRDVLRRADEADQIALVLQKR